VKNLLNVLRRQHSPDVDELSEYADGRGTAAARASVEAHVGGCDACRARLAELTEVRATLQWIQLAEAPRSFRLRQADVERQPRAVPAALGLLRLMPAVSAAAVLVFAVVLGADLATRGESGSGRMAASRANGTSAEIAADAAAPSTDFEAGAAEAGDAPAPGALAPSEDNAGTITDGDDAAARGGDEPNGNVLRHELAETAQAAREEELRATSTDAVADDDDGNRTAFRVVEVVTAVVAVAAGVGALAWWRRSREARA
jgi:hypothetical protein